MSEAQKKKVLDKVATSKERKEYMITKDSRFNFR